MADITITTPPAKGGVQTVHIVYVHGFRGDHTTFQAFPSDLHHHLLPDIPGLQTWVYPTYKSAKPLSFAVANLLTWLKSLSPGSIILAGHSMGGLLVAEAAVHFSPVARRITGVIAFDTPYLGMHPHVVVSGIASLFQKKEDGSSNGRDQKNEGKGDVASRNPGLPAPSAEGMSSEQAINDKEIVKFVNSADAYPQPGAGAGSGSGSGSNTPISTHSYSQHHYTRGELSTPASTLGNLTLLPSSQSGTSSTKGLSSPSFLTCAMSFFTVNADDPFVRFLTKHADAPVAAMSRWVVEHFEFGWAMFDYHGLLDRYEKLENWEGDWVCFWTVTRGETMAEDAGMEEIDRLPTPVKERRKQKLSERLEKEFEKAMHDAREKDAKKRESEIERMIKQEKKERVEREKARRKEEEAQERRRKKEEAAQEKERKRAAELLEKERKAREVAEEKERAKKVKQEEKRVKTQAKQLNKSSLGEGGSTGQKHKLGSPESGPTSSRFILGPEVASVHDEPPPEVVVEASETSRFNDDEEFDKSGHGTESVTQSSTMEENADSAVPTPSRSLVVSPSPAPSRPPSPARASAHHFITLPGVLYPRKRKHWLKVRIAGVDDEVAAHCGLFIRSQNLEYDMFVERVGNVVKSWVL